MAVVFQSTTYRKILLDIQNLPLLENSFVYVPELLKFWPALSQVLVYAQQSKEIFNHQQTALNERMEEYKRQVDQESRLSLNGSQGSSQGDAPQPFPKSHKMIEAVMQSSTEGKVFIIFYFPPC